MQQGVKQLLLGIFSDYFAFFKQQAAVLPACNAEVGLLRLSRAVDCTPHHLSLIHIEMCIRDRYQLVCKLVDVAARVGEKQQQLQSVMQMCIRDRCGIPIRAYSRRR